MRSHLSPVGLAVTLALFSFAAGGCGGDDDDDSESAAPEEAAIETPAVLQEAGRLVVCADMTYPPLTFMEGNEPTGVDVDLANQLTGLMGTEAEFVQTGFPGIIAALQSGKCDAIMNGLNVDAERDKEIDFVIYAQAAQTFMVNTDQAGEYQTLEDFSGADVGVQVGSVNRKFLEETNEELEADGVEPINVVPFPKDPDAISALQTGNLDAYFADIAVTSYYETQSPEQFTSTDIALNPVPYGIGIREDEDELELALQEGVNALYEDGEVQAILDEWNMGENAYREEERAPFQDPAPPSS
jgi:polar amino acid transport system substrate-binding protein